MKKILALLLVCMMMFTVLASCGNTNEPATDDTAADTQNSGSDDTTTTDAKFKIGAIGPLTGGAAIYGQAAINGMEIAVEEINALGGDIQFEFKAEDDVHDAETSVNAYNTLYDWGVQGILGTVTTTPCIAVSAQAYEDRIVMITPSASSEDVINGKDNMFQICFTDPNQGIASADYMAENMKDAKIAVIYKSDDAYSTGIHDTFTAECTAKNLSVVYDESFTEATSTDFSVQLTAAQAAGADLLFLPIYYTPAAVILQQAHDMGYAPTVFGVDGMDGILTVENFDTSLAEGVMLLTPFSADAEDERTQNFVSKYQEKHSEVPNQFAADGYDAVYTFYEALKAANCTPDMSAQDICEAVIGAMASLSVDGLTGQGMTWDENGAVSKAPMAVVIKDGAYVLPTNG